MNPTYLQLFQLLVLHGGSCAVVTGSPMHIAALELERIKFVQTHPISTDGMAEVKLFNFQPLRLGSKD